MADHIPLEICREIFLRLPAVSLIRFRSVCKSWCHVIDYRSFIKAHTNKQLSSNTILIRNSTDPPFYPLYSVDLETLEFADGLQEITATPLNFNRKGLSCLSRFPVEACNGLMLVGPFEKGYVYKKTWEIWNPLTHEHLRLPQPNFCSHYLVSGLGYDYATDDYKVVMLGKRGHYNAENFGYKTHVYSLKSDSWRQIMDVPLDRDWYGPGGPGVFLNGALHWISREMIYVFDIGIENYRRLKLPASQDRERVLSVRQNQIDVLGGCLVMSEYVGDPENFFYTNFNVWEMKDYGSQESWVKLFSFAMHKDHVRGLSLRPVACMENKMQIVLQDHEGLYLFDVASDSLKTVGIHGLSQSLSAQSFRGSLFRIHDNCGVSGSVGTKRRMRKRKDSKMKMKMADNKYSLRPTKIGMD